MRRIVLISIFSFIYGNLQNDSVISESSDSLNLNLEVKEKNPDNIQNKKVNRIFNTINKLENVFYIGLGLGVISWFFLDGEADFYYNKYDEYKGLYEFNNQYNSYLNKSKAYQNLSNISSSIAISSAILLIVNKIHKKKHKKSNIDNQLNNDIKE